MPVFNMDTPIEIRWGKSIFSDYRSAHQLPIPQWHSAGGEFFRLGAAHRCSPQTQCNCKNLRKDGESRWHTRAFSSRRRALRWFCKRRPPLCLSNVLFRGRTLEAKAGAFAYMGLPRLILDLTE